MKRRRPWLFGALAAAALLALGLYLARVPLSLALAERVAARQLALDFMGSLPDGLHVAVCGAGSPFPDELRSGPCTAVVAGDKLLVFDAGSGASRQIGRFGLSQGRIDAVFLTHFHSDHIDGLGELMLQRWVAGSRQAPLPVHGPKGVEQITQGLMAAYAPDQGYRVAHHGETYVPPTGFGARAQGFELPTGAPVVVYREGDLSVQAFAVVHDPVHPAVGYRIEYRGRSVVLSGDTRKSDAVVRAAKGADLLLHEALSPRLMAVLKKAAQDAGRGALAKIFHDIHDYHSTPEDAAQVAQAAGVGQLVLHHIVPTLPPLPGLEAAFLGDAAQHFSGPLRVARDGDFFSLPAQGRATAHRRVY